MLSHLQPWRLNAMFWVIVSITIPMKTQQVNMVDSPLHFFQDSIYQYDKKPADQAIPLPEYDFIIVGAGTAGCVVANRLTEMSDWKVLLVEAGANENFLMDIPMLAVYLQRTPADWAYKTKPSDNYCTGFENKQCNWPRGKVVGGSSVLNFMIYTRGAKEDYNNWESMGNKEWGFDSVLPYFRKIENFNILSFNDAKYHGYNGNLNVEFSRYRSTKGFAWVKAAEELGFRYGDLNGADPSGVSFLQLSMKNGTRHSSSRAYLHPVSNRNNLHVSKFSLVTKVLFDHSNTRAIGIEIEKLGRRFKVLAKKEVILTAGAINSPQLLMLSGIGPKEHLNTLNIPVRKDLPVGYNLMDHVATGGLQFIVDKTNYTQPTDYFSTRLNMIFKWMINHEGPLSVAGGSEALVVMDLKDKFNKTAWPDIELLFINGGLNKDPVLKTNFGFTDKMFTKAYGPLQENDAFTILPMLMRPKSKGRVMLRSKNAKDHPTIIPNYFEHDEDLRKIVEAIKVAIEITKQPTMKKIGAKIYDVPIPECLNQGPFGSDAYFACQTQMFTFTVYHQSGTCKMGPKGDPTAVVDPLLIVHGFSNLRVIDASIMPEIVSSHTNAPTYMIAEKGSDMIKKSWGKE